MSELYTFIPAGGLGTRLHPHTLPTPKPLLPMGNGQRIIDHPLNLCTETSTHTWVSTDYLGEQLDEYLADRPYITTCQDSGTVGSGGSLMQHYKDIAACDSDSDMLILPSDHIYEGIDLTDFWHTHKNSEADITLLTVPNKSYGEYVKLSDDDFPVSISKVPDIATVSTTGIFMLRTPYLMDVIRKARAQQWDALNIYGDIICPAIGATAVAHHFIDASRGFWEDTGTLKRYHESNMRLSRGENVVDADASIVDEARVKRCVILGSAEIGMDESWKDCIVTGTAKGELLVSQL